MSQRPRSKAIAHCALSLLVSTALSSCEVGPDYHAPKFQLPKSFAAASQQKGNAKEDLTSKAPTAVDSAQWWKSLNDKTLDGLIDRAITANPQLEIALAHVQQAREQEAVVLGTELPQVDTSLGAARGTGSDLARGRAAQSLVSAESNTGYTHVTHIYGFDAGWELDLFGKYRREAEAASYDEQAAEAARNNVLITIIADVVHGYVDMRGLQMQKAVLDSNIKVSEAYTHLVQQRYDRGITNGLDLTLAQRQLSTLKAQQAPLGAQIRAAQYTIAVLCGSFPEEMVAELDTPGVIPQLPPQLTTGVPLDLLRSRPDIQEAEGELASANAHIGAATADLFPHIALTGGAGYQAQGLGISPSMQSFIWSIGPSVGLPILDFGTLDALVNVADLQTHAMLMNYKQTLLNAVEQVDTATSAYDAQQERLKNLKQALDASGQAVSLASQRYDRGLTDSLNIIDAQRQQFDLEQQYVIAQQTAAEQFVTLYKSLGGGWEHYQKLPDISQPLPAVIAALQRSLAPDKVVSGPLTMQESAKHQQP